MSEEDDMAAAAESLAEFTLTTTGGNFDLAYRVILEMMARIIVEMPDPQYGLRLAETVLQQALQKDHPQTLEWAIPHLRQRVLGTAH